MSSELFWKYNSCITVKGFLISDMDKQLKSNQIQNAEKKYRIARGHFDCLSTSNKLIFNFGLANIWDIK